MSAAHRNLRSALAMVPLELPKSQEVTKDAYNDEALDEALLEVEKELRNLTAPPTFDRILRGSTGVRTR